MKNDSGSPHPIKIVHLITDLDTGGAEMMLAKLLAHMDRERFANIVISLTDRGTLGDQIAALGMPVFTLRMRRGIPDPRGLWRLVRLLRQEKPDVLQTWLYHADLLGLIGSWLVHVPTLCWNIRCSDMDMSRYSQLSRLVLRILARLSGCPDIVIVNSEAGRRLHETLRYSPRRWEIVPNGFDLNRFRPDPAARQSLRGELAVSPDSLLIGLVARYDPMKDHRTFLEAAGLLAREGDGVHFVLVGRGASQQNAQLLALIGKEKLESRIHLLDERSDIPRIMAALDILALSSAFGEGFPSVVGEAMACGVPCVVTDVGDAASIVGETGIVVRPRDPAGMADAWKCLLEMSEAKRQTLGKDARRRVEDRFSIQSISSQYESLYQEMERADRKDRRSQLVISSEGAQPGLSQIGGSNQRLRVLRVVHLITDLDTGGSEMMLAKLLAHMDRERFANIVISLTDRGTLGEQIAALEMPVFTLRMRRGIPDPRGLWRLVRLLRQEKPDVLQTWLYHADLLGLIGSWLVHVPTLCWNIRCSDMDMSRYSQLSRLVLRSLARLSGCPDIVIVNSEAGRRLHETLGYSPRRWEIVPNGFDLNRFRPDPAARQSLRGELAVSPDSLLIGLVARYDPMKDHQTFLEAAGLLAREGDGVHFVLVGRGASQQNAQLLALIGKEKLESRIHLLDERSDIPRIMAALDILALSSLGEGFPNVVGEAMACGVPCVVTDVGDAASIVGETGIVVRPRDPAGMADAWKCLLEMSEAKRQSLGKDARQRVEQLFSIKSVAGRYESLYRGIGREPESG